MTASTEQRTSPLAAWRERFARASSAPAQFAIRECPWTTQLNLRGAPGDTRFSTPVAGVLETPLPVIANTWAVGRACSVLWLGPDEWLVSADDERRAPLLGALREALDGSHHALTDLSAARTVIELSGTHARLVLAGGCPLDLHASAFAPPQCAQSLLARTQITLQCLDGALRLFVRSSFAEYLAAWLCEAAEDAHTSHTLDAERLGARFG